MNREAKNRLVSPPYKTLGVSPHDVADSEYGVEGVICACGNTADASGFSAAVATGRLANITIDPSELPSLPESGTLSVCNSCGCVYANDDLKDASTVISYAVARYDLTDPAWRVDRDTYIQVNLGARVTSPSLW